jgi:hypothetical protein
MNYICFALVKKTSYSDCGAGLMIGIGGQKRAVKLEGYEDKGKGSGRIEQGH